MASPFRTPVLTPARTAGLLAGVAAGALAIGSVFLPHPMASAADLSTAVVRQPVLVELFTSEGCSSCPPADALLARLDTTQFVPGAEAVVLSEHVTYWNYLGWKDPFSLDSLSDRQQKYSTRFGLDSVYTPQVVVDGSAQALGSDSAALARAVAHAAAKPKPELRITNLDRTNDAVTFSVRASTVVLGTLTVALAEDATVSTVRRGENAGRTLHHVAVVRVLKEMGAEAADGRTLAMKLPSGVESGERSSMLRLVVFVADRRTGSVLALAQQKLN